MYCSKGGTLQVDFDNDWENVWILGHAEIENDINIDI